MSTSARCVVFSGVQPRSDSLHLGNALGEGYRYPGDPDTYYEYTSAPIDTKGRFDFEYGKIEATVQLGHGGELAAPGDHRELALRADGALGEDEGASGAREFMVLGAGLGRARSSPIDFDPTPIDSFASISDGVAKVVGVSDDHDAVQKAVTLLRERFGDQVSAARSQPYYADVTNPHANKGAVVSYLSATYDIAPEEIATIGDMPNDVRMFAQSGLSIAMGNASDEVKRAARCLTTTNEDEGFANAVERFILP